MDELLESPLGISSPGIVSAMDEMSFWSAPFGMRLLETIRYSKGLRVLDIGSGLGFPSIELAMRLGESSSVYGIDPWHDAVCRLKDKSTLYGLKNTLVFECRAEKMPFRSGVFDLIVSNNGMNNVQDISGAISEAKRVSKVGSQFVFTFNTEGTFTEFYQAFRETLYDMGMPEYNSELRKHIFEKRKPVAFVENLLKISGFMIESIRDDVFSYYFSDGSAFFRHFFIRFFFLGSWRDIIPPKDRRRFFHELEKRLNDMARKNGHLQLRVPFVVIDCRSS